MVSKRVSGLIGVGAIATCVVLGSVACQSAPETAPAPSEEAPAPAEDPTSDEAPPAVTSDEPTPVPAEDPPAATVAEQSCSATAYVADTDPAGLNVRSGPGSDYAAIDTLPTDGPVEVSIVGTTNGWLLVNEAFSQAGQELEQPGWVYAPLLGVTTTSLDLNDINAPAKLYTAPDGMSAVKGEVAKDTTVTLLSCSGNWLEVQSGNTNGWLAVGDQSVQQP